MEGKYKILWLDDVLWQDGDFVEELEDIKRLYPDIDIEQVSHVDKCRERLENDSKKYDAVILDAMGVNSEDSSAQPDNSGFHGLITLSKGKKLLVYVYSGEIPDDCFMRDSLNEKVGKENIFTKEDGAYVLMEKILDNLNDKYQIYVNNEKYLEFFKKGWLDREVKEPLDNLMKAHRDENLECAYNDFRKVLEAMVKKAYHVLLPLRVDKGVSGVSDMIKDIENEYRGEYGYIVGSLFQLYYLGNAGSHIIIKDEYKKKIFEAGFSALFVVADWFYEVMNDREADMANSRMNDSKAKNNGEKNWPGEKLNVHTDDNNGVYVEIKAYIRNKDMDEIKKKGELYVTGCKFKGEKWLAIYDIYK